MPDNKKTTNGFQIAALFVRTDGVYFGLPFVDPWDEPRDARLYKGPFPVVCHSPCQRWGRYWSGGPSAKVRRIKGDDDGCFAHAKWAVDTFGGVLEHPEASHAWEAFGIPKPPRKGGWIPAGRGWTCCVEQGHYGHRARKATWLYAVTPEKPADFIWGASAGERLDEGFHTREERQAARAAGQKAVPRLSVVENLSTPPLFRDLLIAIAVSAAQTAQASTVKAAEKHRKTAQEIADETMQSAAREVSDPRRPRRSLQRWSAKLGKYVDA